jgi:hypothetical protein
VSDIKVKKLGIKARTRKKAPNYIKIQEKRAKQDAEIFTKKIAQEYSSLMTRLM